MSQMTKNALVDKWFHSFYEDGKIKCQGQIAAVIDNYCLLQYYDWLVGAPNNLKLVPLSEICTYTLYVDNEDMNRAFQSAERKLNQTINE